jgi:hypothetical protein
VIHEADAGACAADETARPFQRKLTSRSDVKARSALLKLKKRHVEVVTRLPTERLATACWAFIVVKRTGLEPAPMLVFRPLLLANMEKYQQDINRMLRHASASLKCCQAEPGQPVNASRTGQILAPGGRNPRNARIEVKGH